MHEAWHVVVLLAAVLGAGSAMALVVGPLVWQEPPAEWSRWRRALVTAAGAGASLVILEWLGVH